MLSLSTGMEYYPTYKIINIIVRKFTFQELLRLEHTLDQQ